MRTSGPAPPKRRIGKRHGSRPRLEGPRPAPRPAAEACSTCKWQPSGTGPMPIAWPPSCGARDTLWWSSLRRNRKPRRGSASRSVHSAAPGKHPRLRLGWPGTATNRLCDASEAHGFSPPPPDAPLSEGASCFLPPGRISHRAAGTIMKNRLSSIPYWPLLEGMRVQTALGPPWLVLFPSARTCSLERSPRYALRSRARAEGKIPAPLSRPPVRNAG